MIRSLAFNLYFYLGTLLVAVIGILLVPIPTPVLLRGLLFGKGSWLSGKTAPYASIAVPWEQGGK